MPRFVHERHKPPIVLDRPRELVVACAPMKSNVNLSRIVRTAGCVGVRLVICCGNARIVEKIARDSLDDEQGDDTGVSIRVHRTLPGSLKELKAEGFELVGLEQAAGSTSLFEFAFKRRTVLVVGNERQGLDAEVLSLMDQVVEIPVYGLPASYNVATAAAMALYEFCRQYPRG